MGRFIDTLRTEFRKEFGKQARPHIKTALVNTLDRQRFVASDEEVDIMVEDFIEYFRASVKADKK